MKVKKDFPAANTFREGDGTSTSLIWVVTGVPSLTKVKGCPVLCWWSQGCPAFCVFHGCGQMGGMLGVWPDGRHAGDESIHAAPG